jgi:hypothetical protein
MDYSGYCQCREGEKGKFCNWVSYFYHYDDDRRNRNLQDPPVDCYKEPNFRSEEGFCSCATDLDTGSRFCQWWVHTDNRRLVAVPETMIEGFLFARESGEGRNLVNSRGPINVSNRLKESTRIDRFEFDIDEAKQERELEQMELVEPEV